VGCAAGVRAGGAEAGDWRTAQRTIKKSATIGIFRKTMSQMKVQASTPSQITTSIGRPETPE